MDEAFTAFFEVLQHDYEELAIEFVNGWAAELNSKVRIHRGSPENEPGPIGVGADYFVVRFAGFMDEKTGERTDVIACDILRAQHWAVSAVIEEAWRLRQSS